MKRVIDGDPSLVHERSSSWGPPLHAAALQGLDEHVKFLLEAGADPRGLDHAGRGALACARLAQSEPAPRVVALLEAALSAAP